MDKQNEIQKTKLLLVEGNHERDVFGAWLKALDRTDIQVMPIAGKTRLRAELGLLVKQTAFPTVTSLVVVRDADASPTDAFISVRDALASTGVPIPERPWELTEGDGLRTAIVIVPGPDRAGALEDLLLPTMAGDPLAADAHDFIADAVTTLDRQGGRPPPPPHRRSKAEAHAFLATFEEPDRDPGKAALAGVWDFEHETLGRLRAILDEL